MAGGHFNGLKYIMSYNLNAGYGRMDSETLTLAARGGKSFVVCPNTSPAWPGIYQSWVVDNDGFDRLFSSVQEAVNMVISSNGAGRGDTIYIAPGSYNESVVIPRTAGPLFLIGLGGRGDAAIEPSTAGAVGLTFSNDDLTLINIDVAGDDTALFAVTGTGSRFRAYNCKFEGVDASGSNAALGIGPGSVADVAAGLEGNSGDTKIYNTEFCWSGTGIAFVASDYGVPTQVYVEGCLFHNISANGMVGVPGAFGIDSVRNLVVTNCIFDNAEDGTAPVSYVFIDGATDTGIFCHNCFATATNAAAVLTVGAGIKWVCNCTEAGESTARPA